ncbi:tetratricopeptide repeat protein [Streptomyces sp. NPDC046876]|uniref:tetratricopeptide repeat protein n=1 Tax=Streptomyces sp. NPDC046876 TaxID=3155616 RepID=UPI0033F498A8
MARGRTDEALTVLREALAVAESGGASSPRMCMLRWVADAHRIAGRRTEAEAAFREVLAFTAGCGDLEPSLVRALAVPPLARALLAAGDPAAARHLLEKAVTGCRRMDPRRLLTQPESALAELST